MKIIVHNNSAKDVGGKRSKIVAKKLVESGFEVLFDKDFYGYETATEEDFAKADVLLTLGGDGTVLSAASSAIKFNLPILGINIGNLGYLTAFEYSETDKAIECLKTNRLVVDDRALLETTFCGKTFLALNEISVASVSDVQSAARIATLSAYSDGEKIDSFRADGLIISTPTGSTAYSLAAGGPIMEPSVRAILLTAICSHSLHNRPICLKNDAVVSVEAEKCSSPCLVSYDGKRAFLLREGEKIEIKTSQKSLTLLKRADESFYQRLYKKMIRG